MVASDALREAFGAVCSDPRRAKLLLGFLASLAAAGALAVDGPGGLGPAVVAPLAARVGDAEATPRERDHFALLLLPLLPVCGAKLAAGWGGFAPCVDALSEFARSRPKVFSAPDALHAILAQEPDGDDGDEDDDDEEEEPAPPPAKVGPRSAAHFHKPLLSFRPRSESIVSYPRASHR